jgi:hypothetical protein
VGVFVRDLSCAHIDDNIRPDRLYRALSFPLVQYEKDVRGAGCRTYQAYARRAVAGITGVRIEPGVQFRVITAGKDTLLLRNLPAADIAQSSSKTRTSLKEVITAIGGRYCAIPRRTATRCRSISALYEKAASSEKETA